MESLSLTNRDLNPANILFNKEKVYKIFDFGSSRIIEEGNQILQSMAVGFNEVLNLVKSIVLYESLNVGNWWIRN